MAMVTCPGCLERDERIAALERRVAELEARLGTNATNSGLPPSASPPGAPKPVTKKRTGNKPGGQPGHPPGLKRRLPPECLHKVIPFVPSHCDRCHEPLPPRPGPDDPEPSWHQVAELPKLAALITEYQGHYRTCPCCGQLNHAPIPQDLKAGRRCADSKAAAFCANVLELLPAVWRFVVTEGVEPTNNHAERVLRRGVLWRKNAFGCQSEAGCRFVQRLLTVVQTRRLQGRSVLRYLHEVLVAHRNGLPSPSLLAAE